MTATAPATTIDGILVSARPLDIWLGACAPCRRGVRTEQGTGDRCSTACPECSQPVDVERLYGTVTAQPCNAACMGATGPDCCCGCGGLNHGKVWQGFGAALASALAAYRTRQGQVEARRAAREERRANKFARWCHEHADVVKAVTEDPHANPFLEDLALQLRNGHELTDNQCTAALRAAERDARRAAERDERDARRAALAGTEPVPAGKVTFTGEILTTRWQDNPNGPGGALKALVDCGAYRLWGTLPSGVFAALSAEAGGHGYSAEDVRGLRGRKVTITATVTPKQGEADFGIFSRPRGTLAVEAAPQDQAAPEPAGTAAQEAGDGTVTECDECGYDFGRPQRRRTCKSQAACERRQAAAAA
jgi:hypothetical protein